MSADELRRAAETLRERANAATPWPWSFETYPNGFAPLVIGAEMAVAETMDKPHLSDARYIATMHPGVGLALADWLDQSAIHVEGGSLRSHPTSAKAIALARLINGGAS